MFHNSVILTAGNLLFVENKCCKSQKIELIKKIWAKTLFIVFLKRFFVPRLSKLASKFPGKKLP